MATKSKTPSSTTTRAGTGGPAVDPSPDSSYDTNISELKSQKQLAYDALRPIQSTWADKERLLIARLSDTYSLKSTRSHVTDGALSTLVFERQARVGAQLPTGSIYSLTSKDEEAAMLMNLVLNKYIIPNANSQFDALTKLRMSGVYASVYGAQPIMYDYRIDDEYIGPDFYLIPARNFYPQPGKNSIRDCDWVMVSTIVSVSYLQSLAKRDNTSWNKEELNKLIDQAKKGVVPARDIDSSRKSAIENTRTYGRPSADKGSAARVELITKYEKGKKGKWITFAPDFDNVGILRSIPNPHNNGRIPIVMRQCFPLLDSIWGLGDFERGMTLQKAKDSLINLYLDHAKLMIFPPLKVDIANVTASTLRMEPGARWLMKDPNAVSPYETNAQALSDFQGTYQFLSSALLNQFGTTDTQVSAHGSGNPAFGKTPEAIKALQDREGARDNWDRFQLEKTIEDLWEGMINLLAENQEKPINFHIFDDDVARIQKQFGTEQEDGSTEDPKFMTNMGRSAKLAITKNMLKGEYRFIIDASSTMKQDEDQQEQILTQIMDFYLQNPQVVDQLLQKDGYKFNFGKAFKALVYNSGVQDPDTLCSDSDEPQEPAAPQMRPEHAAFMQNPQTDQDIRNVAQQLFQPQMNQSINPAGMPNG